MPTDTTQTRPPAPPPPPGRPAALTREQVLVAALEIIDEDGVEALTMRRLGQALDRNPMGIYRHAADKDALLDGVVEHVFSELVVTREPGRERSATERAAMTGIGKPRCVTPRTRSAGSPWPTPTRCRSW